MNLYGSLSNGKMVDPVMMRKMAMQMQKQGRKGDTMLAHINPQEARMLKRRGGSGTINPMTGLPEYFNDEDEGWEDSDSSYSQSDIDAFEDNNEGDFTPNQFDTNPADALAYMESQNTSSGDGGGGLTQQQMSQLVGDPEPEPDPYSEEEYNKFLRKQAMELPEFQAYDGEVVAPDPQDVVDAKQGVRDMQTYGRDPITGEFTDVTTATGILQGVGPDDTGLKGDAQALIDNKISADKITASGLKPEISGFQNQYIQSVLDPQLDAIESARAKAMANISSGARRVGAFGGDRQGLMEGQANKDAMKLAGQATDKAYSDAFNQATGLAMQGARANQAYGLQGQIASGNLGLGGIDRMRGITSDITNLGDLSRGRRYQDINALSGIGMDTRGRADMQNRFNFGEFLREQDYPFKTLQARGAIASSLPIKQEQTYYPSSGGGKGGGLF